MTGKQRAVRRQLFPEKLWDLVHKPESGIQWSDDGKRIEVERTQLEKLIGTKFRSHNYDSFIRQLHFYGFRKSGNSYHHDKFQRGQPQALLTMKRKYSNLTLTPLCPTTRTLSSPYYHSNSSSNDSQTNSFSGSNSSVNLSTIYNTSGAIDLSGVPTNQISTNLHSSKNSTAYKESKQLASSNGLDKRGSEGLAIDYSNANSRAMSQFPSKAHGKSMNQNKSLSKLKDESKELTLYTLKADNVSDSINSESTFANTIASFMKIRRDLARADHDENSIKITLPDVLKDSSQAPWPKTLVFENHWSGNQNILSAYFIYGTNESH